MKSPELSSFPYMPHICMTSPKQWLFDPMNSGGSRTTPSQSSPRAQLCPRAETGGLSRENAAILEKLLFCWHVFLFENMWYVLGSWQHFLECWLICVGLCGQVMRQCDWVLRSLSTTCVCYPSTDSGRVWKRDGVRSGFNGEGNLQNCCWGSSLPFWACDALWSLRVCEQWMQWTGTTVLYDFMVLSSLLRHCLVMFFATDFDCSTCVGRKGSGKWKKSDQSKKKTQVCADSWIVHGGPNKNNVPHATSMPPLAQIVPWTMRHVSGVAVKLEEEVKCEEPAPKKRAVMTKCLGNMLKLAVLILPDYVQRYKTGRVVDTSTYMLPHRFVSSMAVFGGASTINFQQAFNSLIHTPNTWPR